MYVACPNLFITMVRFAHVGNMWAQSWSGLDDLTLPYPNTPFPDVTAALKRKVYTDMKTVVKSTKLIK